MTDHSEVRTYRSAFWVVIIVAIALAIIAAVLWRRLSTKTVAVEHSANASKNQPGASGSPTSGMAEAPANAPPKADAPLAPIQLSPQRMQSIGVQIGAAELRAVNDEVRFYGNVQADERRLGYVQTRFSGWIRKVYADATGEFVRKGQPLFTIYSPELVSTEQEYLLAKNNVGTLQQSSVQGVAAGASSLLDAAKQRLLQWDIPPSEIEKLESTGKVITDLTINSPVSGYITEKKIGRAHV